MVESMRYGALDIAVTSRFRWLWDDRGSKGNRDGAFYTPQYPSIFDPLLGWRILAHVGRGNYTHIDRETTVILARGANPADEMLKSPVDFERIWEDRASGAKAYGSAWRPIPPAGYVALGDVFQNSWDKPSTSVIACVRKSAVGGHSYAREADIGDLIYDDKGSGAHMDLSVWKIDPPRYPADSVERLILGLDAFVAGNQYNVKPPRTVYVLDLPPVIAKQNPPARPVLASHAMPDPRETLKVTDRSVVVPCTVVNDPGKTPDWQALNSPFYTLERRVNYYCQMHYDNSQGSSEQNPEDQITTGVSTEASEEYSKRTSISVTASAGINIKAFSASVETSVTTELGYSSRYSVTQFNQRTQVWTLTTPPRHSAALWSPRHEIRAIRKNGDVIGGQGGLVVDVDSRIYTQYPAPTADQAPPDATTETLADKPFGDPQSNIPDGLEDLIAT